MKRNTRKKNKIIFPWQPKSPLRAERGALLAAAIIIYEFMAPLSGSLRDIPEGILHRYAGRICRL